MGYTAVMGEKGAVEPPKFEEAIAELEAIIDQIESGRCGLEECIAQYERGMKLVGSCQSILGVVQQRIAELTADASGKLRAREVRGLAVGSTSTPDAAEGETDADTVGSNPDPDDDSAGRE